jgi:hypothetical protein
MGIETNSAPPMPAHAFDADDYLAVVRRPATEIATGVKARFPCSSCFFLPWAFVKDMNHNAISYFESLPASSTFVSGTQHCFEWRAEQ